MLPPFAAHPILLTVTTNSPYESPLKEDANEVNFVEMSKSIIGDQPTAEMIELQKAEAVNTRKSKSRFGLPEGFRPRSQQNGRTVLLEDNVYRLPSGQEFIPKYPTGTLGKPWHLYALLTAEQFAAGRRGSIYVRTDGSIFDYSVDHLDPSRDMFDTGYTIYDLERTGRYAPSEASKKRQNEDLKPRRLSHAGSAS